MGVGVSLSVLEAVYFHVYFFLFSFFFFSLSRYGVPQGGNPPLFFIPPWPQNTT